MEAGVKKYLWLIEAEFEKQQLKNRTETRGLVGNASNGRSQLLRCADNFGSLAYQSVAIVVDDKVSQRYLRIWTVRKLFAQNCTKILRAV